MTPCGPAAGGEVVGWLDAKKFLETGDAAGLSGMDAVDPGHQRQRRARRGVRGTRRCRGPQLKTSASTPGGFYAVAPAPDGSVWGSILGFPGGVARLVPGDNPSETALTRVLRTAGGRKRRSHRGFLPPAARDIDRDGVAWVALASGHMASFDRRKCAGPLNGPQATGQHCREGWSFHTEPLPQFKNLGPSPAAPKAATLPG